jgi:hypothetical protein
MGSLHFRLITDFKNKQKPFIKLFVGVFHSRCQQYYLSSSTLFII